MMLPSHFASYNIKQAYLALKQRPGFVFSIVSTMGITLGALLCVLTLAYVMLLKPLPYPDQSRLYHVEHQLLNQGNIDGRAFTYPNLMHLYKHQQMFEKTALAYFDGAVITSLDTEPMAEISFVTPQWFEIFAIKLLMGRSFESSEALNTHHPVAIISYDFWQTEFAGTTNILNQSVTFSGRSYRIIGVTDKNNIELPISGADFSTKLFIPWDFNTVSDYDRKAWGNDDSGLQFIGKLKKEMLASQTPSQRDQQLTALVNENWKQNVNNDGFFKGWGIHIETSKLKSFIVSDGKKSLFLLLIGTLGLVMIACVNIANLFISHTAERQKQLAICAAMGAKKKQLFSGIFSEVSILMLLAMIFAQAIAYFGFFILREYLGDNLPRINELSLNAFSFAASCFMLIVVTLLFSYVSMRMVNYHALNTMIQTSGKGTGIQVSKRVRNILIVSQIAVATSLIFINITLNKDATTLINQPLGYETDNRYSVVLSLPNVERALNEGHLTDLKKALLASPKIVAVSQSMRPSGFGTFALTNKADNQRFSIAGKDVDEHYFPTINQAIIEGDNFTAQQRKDGEQVTIINDVFARKLAPNSSAIGTVFNNGSRVIGVVKSITVPGKSTVGSRFYFPSRQSRNMLLLKVAEGQHLTKDELLPLLKSVHKSFSIFSFASLNNYKNERLLSATTTAYTTITLTIFTVFLSGLGLYGILKYSSQMRRFEIGTRMAIGAKRKSIVFMVMRDNAVAVIIGIALSAIILTNLYIAFNEQIKHYALIDLCVLFVSTVGLICTLSFIAGYLPLRQYINKPVIWSLKGTGH